ncbi:MAG TPA: hypothetical protein VGQ33_20770, partial [Vicinamibacteria bacterium]|nr:hypothetical protein [Vicinamibacteria bacterium]
RAAWNLGHWMGLERLPTLLPLAAWIIAVGTWLRRDVLAFDRDPEARKGGAEAPPDGRGADGDQAARGGTAT